MTLIGILNQYLVLIKELGYPLELAYKPAVILNTPPWYSGRVVGAKAFCLMFDPLIRNLIDSCFYS